VAYRKGGVGVQPPPPKFQNFVKAEPNSQFRGICIRNNLIRMRFHSFANRVEPLTRGYRPQIPVLSALCSQLNLSNPPPSLPRPKKVLGTPLPSATLFVVNISPPFREFRAPTRHILPIHNVTINTNNLFVNFRWTFTFCIEKLYDGTHLAFDGTLDRRCHFKHVSIKQSRFYHWQTSTAHSSMAVLST
jgi:hypothetical protein